MTLEKIIAEYLSELLVAVKIDCISINVKHMTHELSDIIRKHQSEQPTQGVIIGEYSLTKITPNKVFIQHSSGESGEFSEADFANTVKAFFMENF